MSGERKISGAINTLILGGVVATLITSLVNIFLAYTNLETQKKIENHRVYLETVEKKCNMLREARSSLFKETDWVPALEGLKSGSDEELGKMMSVVFTQQVKQHAFLEENRFLFESHDLSELDRMNAIVLNAAKAMSNSMLQGSISSPVPEGEARKREVGVKISKAFNVALDYSKEFKEIINLEIARLNGVLLSEH